MHWLHHIIGTCGEYSHPSLLWLLGLGGTVGMGLKLYWMQIKEFYHGEDKIDEREDI